MNGFVPMKGTIFVSIVKVLVSPEGCYSFSYASVGEIFTPGQPISRIKQSPRGNHTTRRNLIITQSGFKPDSNTNSLSGFPVPIDSIFPLLHSSNLLLARDF